MFGEIRSVYDDLARVTAKIDQAQATIDEARLLYQSNQTFQLELDRKQSELDLERKRAKLMRDIADIVYGK
jgi:hypothetical protein